MPSFPVLVSSLLIPTAAVLAGSFIPAQPMLRRASCQTTYSSKGGDTCETLDKKYGLVSGTILNANTFLTCSDIWVNTPICVPDGPYACSETYYSKKGDTCDTIEKDYELDQGSILSANTFLTCTDIWENTPICIPADECPTIPPTMDPTTMECKSTYTSVANDTCDTLDKKFNLTPGSIKSANSFVTCTDIWAGTPLCIPSGGCTTETYISQEKETWYVSLRSPSE